MKKFDLWNKEKVQLHVEKARPFFREAEVWFCALGANIGFEQDGRGEYFLRPMVIVKKFNHDVCWAMPLTKHQKVGIHYFSFSFTQGVISTAILSQIRLIDGKRLHYKAGYISDAGFLEIKKRLSQFLE